MRDGGLAKGFPLNPRIKSILKHVPYAKQLAIFVGVDNRHFLLKMLPKQSVGAEIGVNLGDFSSRILRTVKPAELHLIDPWKHEESGEYKGALYGGTVEHGQFQMDERYESVCRRFAADIRSGQVTVHRGYSGDVLKRFPDGYFDWVYIDGNHLYEFVDQDLELSFRKTRAGGYIAGDDYGRRSAWWKDGVDRAVDDFIKRKPVHLVKIHNCQFILQR